ARGCAASCEEPTFTCGRIRSIVSGLLFTMKIATRTCEPSARGAMRSPAFAIAGHSALKTRVRALGRLLSMRDITIARAECFAKQGCGFSLFSSCSVLLSTAGRHDPSDAARADFSFSSRRLRETRNARLWHASCFSLVIYREIQEARGSPSQVAAAAADHYLTRCRRGTVEGQFCMALLPLFRSRTREAQLAHRVFALPG